MIALSTTLHTSFDEAVELTREALAQQGFGILKSEHRLTAVPDPGANAELMYDAAVVHLC